MKKILLPICTFILFCFSLKAQTPNSFKYQAVVRNNANAPLANTAISVKLSLLVGSETGSVAYSEEHKATTTDLGLIALNIGTGTVVGSTNFNTVNWANGPYFLKTEVDIAGGTNYQLMGVSQLMSVPYALFAEKVANNNDADADPVNEIQLLSVDAANNAIVLSKNGGSINMTQFKDADGDPINEIQELSVDATNNTIVLSKNGGSINMAQFKDADGDPINEIQELSIDATNNALILSKNGGSINLNQLKDGDAQTLNYNQTTQELSISNGNKIVLPLTTTVTNSLIQDTDKDTKIRVEAATNENKIKFDVKGGTILTMEKTTNGVTLFNTTEPTFNTIFSSNSGFYLKGSISAKEGVYNTFIGSLNGIFASKSSSNVFVGYAAGKDVLTGSENTIIGTWAGGHEQDGLRNTYVGYASGGHHKLGNDNVFVGYAAGGTSNTLGERNTVLGAFAGGYAPGNGNVMIGNYAGYSEAGNNKLYIETSQSSTPLVYGEFDNDIFRINGKLQNTHSTALGTDGFSIINSGANQNSWRMHTSNDDGKLLFFSKSFSATNGATAPVASIDPATGAYTSLSDGRYKKNFEILNTTLSSIQQLHALKYHFIGQNDSDKKSLGFIAQDVEKVFPELVTQAANTNSLQLNYNGLSVVAIKAIQEQQNIIDKQSQEIQTLKTEMDALKEQMAKLLKAIEKN